MDSKPLKCQTFVTEVLATDIVIKYISIVLCAIKIRIPVSGRFSLVTVKVFPIHCVGDVMAGRCLLIDSGSKDK